MEIQKQSVIILPSKKRSVSRHMRMVTPFLERMCNEDHAQTWTTNAWDVMKPDESALSLKEAISRNECIVVPIILSNDRAIEQAANIAKRHGYVPHVVTPEMQIDHLELVPMAYDRTGVRKIDFIGDLHGCAEECLLLLDKLGYLKEGWKPGKKEDYIPYLRRHPEGRKTLLLGDLTDRGPYNLACLLIARRLDELGMLRVLGNHDEKCARVLLGANINLPKGLQKTMREMARIGSGECAELGEWLGSAQSQLILDGGRVVAAHAGVDTENQGRNTKGSRAFALYGPGSDCGGKDENGYPLRRDWAHEYRSDVVVVHGHVVHKDVRMLNNVVSIDTGCVFGGKLTAYRWPEREIVQVQAKRVHWSDGRFD